MRFFIEICHFLNFDRSSRGNRHTFYMYDYNRKCSAIRWLSNGGKIVRIGQKLNF